MARGINKTQLLVEAHRQGRTAQKASLQAQGVELPQHKTGKKAAKAKAPSKKAPSKKAPSKKAPSKKAAAKKAPAKKTAAKKTVAKKS